MRPRVRLVTDDEADCGCGRRRRWRWWRMLRARLRGREPFSASERQARAILEGHGTEAVLEGDE